MRVVEGGDRKVKEIVSCNECGVCASEGKDRYRLGYGLLRNVGERKGNVASWWCICSTLNVKIKKALT